MITSRSNAVVEYISIADEAVEGTEWLAKFLRTLKLEDIPVTPGKTPTIFKLRRLDRKTRLRIGVGIEELSPAQQNEVIAHGLKGVQNWRGGSLSFVLKGAGPNERVSEETLDAMDAPELFNELATIIVKLSSLSPLDE